MATYLELVNAVCRRLNEDILTVTSFAGAEAVHGQIKEGVNATLQDLYRKGGYFWPFLKQDQTFVTTPGVATYAPPASQRHIDWESFHIFRDDTVIPAIIAEPLLPTLYKPYMQYRRSLDEQLITSQYSKPRYVARNQANQIVLTHPPDRAYTIGYEAWIMPAALSAPTDVCIVPDDYKHIVADGAMLYAYSFRTDTDNMLKFEKKFNDSVNELIRNLIPMGSDVYAMMVNERSLQRVNATSNVM